MNSEVEEKRIRNLFSELRDQDSNRASDFEREWQAARTRLAGRRAGPRVALKPAFVALSILLLAGAAIVSFLNHESRSAQQAMLSSQADRTNSLPMHDGPLTQGIPATQTHGLAPLPSSQQPSSQKELVKMPRHTNQKRIYHTNHPGPQDSDPIERVMVAQSIISNWHSPTDFLLKIDDDRLLRSVPRVDDSLVRIEPNRLRAQ